MVKLLYIFIYIFIYYYYLFIFYLYFIYIFIFYFIFCCHQSNPCSRIGSWISHVDARTCVNYAHPSYVHIHIVSRCHSHWVKFAKNLCPNLTPPGQISSLWEESINLIEWVPGFFFFFFFQLSEIAIMARIKHSSWLKWLVSWNVCTRGRQLGFVFSKHLVIYICIFWISIIWLLQNVQWSLIWLCVSSPPKKTRWF